MDSVCILLNNCVCVSIVIVANFPFFFISFCFLCRSRAGCTCCSGLADPAGQWHSSTSPPPPRRCWGRLQHRNPPGGRRLCCSLSRQRARAELPPHTHEYCKSLFLITKKFVDFQSSIYFFVFVFILTFKIEQVLPWKPFVDGLCCICFEAISKIVLFLRLLSVWKRTISFRDLTFAVVLDLLFFFFLNPKLV